MAPRKRTQGPGKGKRGAKRPAPKAKATPKPKRTSSSEALGKKALRALSLKAEAKRLDRILKRARAKDEKKRTATRVKREASQNAQVEALNRAARELLASRRVDELDGQRLGLVQAPTGNVVRTPRQLEMFEIRRLRLIADVATKDAEALERGREARLQQTREEIVRRRLQEAGGYNDLVNIIYGTEETAGLLDDGIETARELFTLFYSPQVA